MMKCICGNKKNTFTGDISYQLYIKERQKCKPFKYFMEVVAPDMLDRYPYEEPAEFASGAIQSLADKNFCIDILNRPKDEPVGKHFTISIGIIWSYGFINFQGFTIVGTIRNDHKIINTLYCDSIGTSQR